GNLIGTDNTGKVALGNSDGILVESGGNSIGGATSPPGTGAGNVIAGNTYGIYIDNAGYLTGTTTIIGNAIGAVALAGGGTSRGKGYGVITHGAVSDVQIGGTNTGDGNLISGDSTAGIEILGGSAWLIQGNLIGTNLTGTSASPNGNGIVVQSGSTG